MPPDRPPVTPTRLGLWRRRPAVLFGTAAALAVLAIVLAVMGGAVRGPGQLTATQSATPGTRTLPNPQAPRIPQPVQQPPQEAAQIPQPEQLEQTVREYYGLLPEDTTEAWELLGPAEQAQGFERYDKFWDGIDRISIRGPIAVRGNTVLVNLLFEPANRRPTVERYRLNMSTSPVGDILIQSASRVGTFRLTGG